MHSGKPFASTAILVMLLIAMSATIAKAAVSPGTLSFTNPDTGFTNSTHVTLAISNPDPSATKISISNTATPCTAWTAIPTTTPPWAKAWSLTAGDGIKTVYGYLKNSGGEVGTLLPPP